MLKKPLVLLVVFVAFCYFIGSLLAYPLFEWLDDPIAHPLHKLARHCTLLSGLMLSFLLIRLLGLSNETIFGFHVGFKYFFKHLINGLVIGCLILIIVESLLVFSGIHVFDQTYDFTIDNFSELLLKGLITGLVVGLLEEILFRGTIYKSIEKDFSTITVIIITALVYSSVHFIQFPVVNDATTVNWLTGPMLLPDAFLALFTFEIWDTFLTLFLLGVLLAIFRAKYLSIAYCIGIHAGVVMMLKVSRKLTDYNPETHLEFLVNTSDRQMGILAAIVLGIFCVYFYYKLLIKDK